MKIQVADITESPRELKYAEGVDELNGRLARGASEYQLPSELGIDVSYYRSGSDLFFHGSLRGRVRATCGRCLEEYEFALDLPLTLVLAPREETAGVARELSADDVALTFYEGKEVDLTPLVYEQILLALPTRPLCHDDCRGLCPSCGANLNLARCTCAPASAIPRLAVLRDLVGRK
jgi:uncharacterized protein